MSSLAKSDIFFFITSLVVIIIGIGVTWAFFYIINILRDVKDVSRTVKEETKEIVEDISELRTNVKKGSFASILKRFWQKLFKPTKRSYNQKKK